MEGKTYKEFQSEMCPDPTPEPSPPSPPPPPPPPIPAIIAGATVGGVFVVVVVCTVMRLTNRNTTLEESATQPPVAVEPQGNQSSDPERNEEMPSTREEEDAVIRVAFDILDRDHKRNLVRRLENVMR